MGIWQAKETGNQQNIRVSGNQDLWNCMKNNLLDGHAANSKCNQGGYIQFQYQQSNTKQMETFHREVDIVTSSIHNYNEFE